MSKSGFKQHYQETYIKKNVEEKKECSITFKNLFLKIINYLGVDKKFNKKKKL
jgi:hypothetical protein